MHCVIMPYHDGEAVNRAPVYFEGQIEGLCSQILSTFLDEIWVERDQYCTEQA